MLSELTMKTQTNNTDKTTSAKNITQTLHDKIKSDNHNDKKHANIVVDLLIIKAYKKAEFKQDKELQESCQSINIDVEQVKKLVEDNHLLFSPSTPQLPCKLNKLLTLIQLEDIIIACHSIKDLYIDADTHLLCEAFIRFNLDKKLLEEQIPGLNLSTRVPETNKWFRKYADLQPKESFKFDPLFFSLPKDEGKTEQKTIDLLRLKQVINNLLIQKSASSDII